MININFIGLIGGFIIGPLARRYRKQLEVTKVTLPLSAMAATLLREAVKKNNFRRKGHCQFLEGGGVRGLGCPFLKMCF